MTKSNFAETMRKSAWKAERPLEGVAVPPEVIMFVAIGMILLYATNINGNWRPSYDCSHYLILGQSLADGNGYRLNGEPDNTFPPGMALLLAGVFRTVGSNFYVFHALMALAAVGALAAVYASMKRLTDPATALIVAVLMGLSYRFYNAAGSILTDITTTMLLWWCIYACLRFARGRVAWLALAVAMSAMAVLFRSAGMLMMGALGVGIVLHGTFGTWRRRLSAAVAVVLPAVAMTAVFYAMAIDVSGEVRYESQFQSALSRHSNPVLAFGLQLAALADRLPRLLANLMTGQQFAGYGWTVIAFIAIGVVASIRRRQGLAPAMCILYPMGLVLVLIIRYAVHVRMWFPIQPLLTLLALQGLGAVAVSMAEVIPPPRTWRSGPWPAGLLLPVFAFTTFGINSPRLAHDAFINIFYTSNSKYYDRMDMPEIGDFFPIAERAAILDPHKRVFIHSFHEAKLMQYLSGRLTVEWPDVEQSQPATAESAGVVHRTASENKDVSTVVVSLRYRIVRPFAAEVRKLFDDDPAWREILSNKHYVLYQRQPAGEWRSDPPAATVPDPD